MDKPVYNEKASRVSLAKISGTTTSLWDFLRSSKLRAAACRRVMSGLPLMEHRFSAAGLPNGPSVCSDSHGCPRRPHFPTGLGACVD